MPGCAPAMVCSLMFGAKYCSCGVDIAGNRFRGVLMLRRITAKATIHRAPTGIDENGYPLNTGAWETWSGSSGRCSRSGHACEYEEQFAKGRRTVTARLRVSCPLQAAPHPDDVVTIPGLEDGGPFVVWMVSRRCGRRNRSPRLPVMRVWCEFGKRRR